MVQSIIVQGFASKMKSSLLLGVVLFVSLFSGASLQAGDIAAGEKVFRKCSACHVSPKNSIAQARTMWVVRQSGRNS